MDIATLIPLALKASIVLAVFGLGLTASPRDVTCLLRSPERLARSLLSMYVAMPLVAAVIAAAFDLHPAVEIALLTLAVAPVPPLLPRKAMKAGGQASYAIGLLVAAAVLAIVFTPLAVALLGRAFGVPARMPPAAIARLVLLTVLAPLAAGLLARRGAPALAERAAKPITLAATAMLVASALPIFFTAWPAIESLVGNGTLIAIATFVLVGLGVGHLLGGPDHDDRTVQALSTASRHPGIALAIASANFPEQKLVPAAILLYLIVSAVASLPYLAWSKRRPAVHIPV